jgi:hypothetical protein
LWVFNLLGVVLYSSATDEGNLSYVLLALRWERRTRESEVDVLVTEELELRARRHSELRRLLVTRGFEPPDWVGLSAVLQECPDVDLAFTALTMVPRPRWVQDLVGPLRL